MRSHLKNGLRRKPQYPNLAVRCRGNPRASARGGCQEYGVFGFDELRGLMELAQTNPHELAWSLIDEMLVDEPDAVEQTLFDEITRVPPPITSASLFDQSVRDYREVVPDVDVPTRVCLGEDETMLENGGVEYVADKTPGAQLERFSNSGHCPFLEEPEQFNHLLSSFITARC